MLIHSMLLIVQSWNDLSALESAPAFSIIVQVILELVGYIVLNWISLGEEEGIHFFLDVPVL